MARRDDLRHHLSVARVTFGREHQQLLVLAAIAEALPHLSGFVQPMGGDAGVACALGNRFEQCRVRLRVLRAGLVGGGERGCVVRVCHQSLHQLLHLGIHGGGTYTLDTVSYSAV